MSKKSDNMYEIRLLDGTNYKGKITHMDDEMIVLKLGTSRLRTSLRVFHDMIISVQKAASSEPVGACVCFPE